MNAPRILIVMGVSGVGKTTVGQALATDLGWDFYDADAFHPPENVAKMKGGLALTEADRTPWIAALRALIEASLEKDEPTVLACSALRAVHRNLLRVDRRVHFVYLHAPREVVENRMRARDHFMPPTLLSSQLAVLEPPQHALAVDATQEVDVIVAEVRERLAL